MESIPSRLRHFRHHPKISILYSHTHRIQYTLPFYTAIKRIGNVNWVAEMKTKVFNGWAKWDNYSNLSKRYFHLTHSLSLSSFTFTRIFKTHFFLFHLGGTIHPVSITPASAEYNTYTFNVYLNCRWVMAMAMMDPHHHCCLPSLY